MVFLCWTEKPDRLSGMQQHGGGLLTSSLYILFSSFTYMGKFGFFWHHCLSDIYTNIVYFSSSLHFAVKNQLGQCPQMNQRIILERCRLILLMPWTYISGIPILVASCKTVRGKCSKIHLWKQLCPRRENKLTSKRASLFLSAISHVSFRPSK